MNPGDKNGGSCQDNHDPESITPDAALATMLQAIHPLPGHETLPLRQTLHRVLATDVLSDMDVPPARNSAMDGYALNGAELPVRGATRPLRLVGASLAGRPHTRAVQRGECVRIMTGALMPEGTDTVVIQERARREGQQIHVDDRTRTGENVRAAGEDLRRGDTVLRAGNRLGAAELGLLASLGIGEVSMHKKPKVAFFSTGDELCSIGEPLVHGAIYDSNRYTLHGMLTRLGVQQLDLGVVKDEPQVLRRAVQEAARQADAVITTGGVSVGEADYVKEILGELGRMHLWKVAMKPGRPLVFGRIGAACFFGLPGNPVSVMVTFYQFVQPALQKMMGLPASLPLSIEVPCATALKKRPGRVEYQRGILRRDAKGELSVSRTGQQGSGILRSMAAADCFIILPMESSGVEPGEKVMVQPFYGLLA